MRAVRMVMEEQYPLPIRVGVNRGHVFSGDIGTAYRRTFTVMGDTVNLAARLMAAAKPGEIYATATILDQSRTVFATEALEPFSVKGKSEPVQAYRVGPATGSRSDAYGTLPFRGRDKELTTLLDSFASVTTEHGQTALIDAERGMGKTRLVTEFATAATPVHVLWLQGEPQSTDVPYQPLRAPLRSVLGIDARDRTEAGDQLLESILILDRGLAPFAPLLAPIVDADVPPTPESEAIAEEFVRQRVADIVLSTLDAACSAPLLIVAEDAHWFDDTTSDICAHLSKAATSRSWLFCSTRRPDAEGGFEPSNPHIRLPLAPLTDDVSRELVDATTDTAPLRPHESDGIVTRAGGNPLFLEELLRIVRATDIDSLPDTLDAVAMREIDGLPTTPRRVLRLASVLGRSFDRALIDQLLAVELVDAGADALEDLRAQLVSDGDSERIRFRHALLQEAAYQSLPFRQRLELHRTVGEIIERGATEVDDVAPLLSRHFLAAQDWDRTWRYARKAATSAREAHAPAEAAVHLGHAVTAARKLGEVAGEALADVFGELGRTFELLGDYERADDAYRRASNCETDPVRRGQVAYRRSYLRSEYLGKPGAAVRMLRSARKNLDGVGEEAAGLRALLLAGEASARQRQGRITEAIACADLAAEQAERSGEKRALAIALHVRSLSLIMAGRTDAIDFMDGVLELFKELGDDVRVAMTLGNIAVIAFYESQWDKSAHYLTLSAEASTKAGDLACAAMTRGNLGELLTNQGRTDEAVAILGPAARTLESVGWTVMTAGTEAELGRALAFHGDCEGGLVLLRSAVAVLDEIGAHYEALEAYSRLADILVFDNRPTEARSALARARELERVLGETQLAPHIDRLELILAATHNGGMSPTRSRASSSGPGVSVRPTMSSSSSRSRNV